jgi:hypothetical protein
MPTKKYRSCQGEYKCEQSHFCVCLISDRFLPAVAYYFILVISETMLAQRHNASPELC